MIILGGITLALLATVLMLLLANRLASPPAPPVTPATPTTVTTPATTRPATTTHGSTSGFGWLKGILTFMWGLFQVVFIIGLILAILGGLYYGGLWAKKNIDTWAHQGDSGGEELVVIRPGQYTILDTQTSTFGKFMPPVATLVEYLDQSGRPIPVECNGVMIYSIISRPGIDYPVSTSNELRFLRLSSANPDSGEYSFVIKMR